MNQVRNRASARAHWQTSALASRGAPNEIVEHQHVAHIGNPAIIGPAVKARPSLARLPCKNPMLGLYGETVDGELGGVCVLWSRLVVVVAMVVVWVAGVFVCECVCLCVRVRKILCVWV